MDNFPHLNINVEDKSSYEYVDVENLPLHRPLYFIKSAMGEVGKITWVPNMKKARAIFGEDTFNPAKKEYFSRATMFVLTTLENGGGCFIARLGDTTMTKSRAVVWASIDGDNDTITIDVTPGSLVGFGKEVKDTTGNVVTYPLFDFETSYVGSYGDDIGVRLFADPKLTSDQTDSIQSMLYRIGFTKKNNITNLDDKLRTKYSVYDFQFAVKDKAIDPTTGVEVDYDSTVPRYFDSEWPVPVNVHVYNNYIDEYLDMMTTKWASILTHITEGGEDNFGRIDFLNLKIYTPDGVIPFYESSSSSNIIGGAPSWSVTYAQGGSVSQATSIFKSTFVLPMSGGSDGELQDINIDDNVTTIGSGSAKAYAETLIGNIISTNDNPSIVDKSRYPFNHIIDPGWSTTLKTSVTMLLADRDDIKVIMSAWDGVTELNDVAVVDAAADTIVGNIRQISESELFGTKAYRGTVFGQYGYLNDSRYSQLIPLTLWYAAKKAEYGSKDYIDKIPAGSKLAAVEMFRPETINVIPALPSELYEMWNSCVNYCQYADMDSLFFAGIRGVYDNDTSVLASDTFADATVFLKQRALVIYNRYASVEALSTADLYTQVTTEATEEFNHLLGGRYSAEVSMYQTEEEAKIGFIHHMRVVLTGGPAFRVVNLDIICKRTGFNGE